jgi:hypothetical protein
MNARLLQTIAVSLALAMVSAPLVQPRAESPPAPTATGSPLFAPEQLAQLLAPVALYPDPLLAQVMMAATYPVEVVESDRWRRLPANLGLKGDPLAAALAQQRWDPSVKSLAVLPRLLHLLADNLDWTEALGDAFLAQPAVVMDTVQNLRRLARASTALVSGPQQKVSVRDGAVIIEPANPQIVFVPSYNSDLVYGIWPWPADPPDNLWRAPWPQFAIGYTVAAHVVGQLWGWSNWDWPRHQIDIDTGRFNAINTGRQPVTASVWQHNPADRRGVPYADAATLARVEGKPPPGPQPFRGYGVTAAPPAVLRGDANSPPPAAGVRGPTAPVTVLHGTPPAAVESPRATERPGVTSAAARPGEVHAPPPVYESFDRGSQVRVEEARAAASRATPVAVASPGGEIGGGGVRLR